MDIASLVRAVVAAFEDASKLVQRIRDQKLKSGAEPLPDEPTTDLLDSLALGPIIVRGHYDHDVKRFGEQYTCGDGQAREQMKDVLINLQMTLIISLRTIMMDELDMDFVALQTASDDCRVNAGVCLGQLSQRLSSAVQAQSHYPNRAASSYTSSSASASVLIPPMSPSLAYSTGWSTRSSTVFQSPQTPEIPLGQSKQILPQNASPQPSSPQPWVGNVQLNTDPTFESLESQVVSYRPRPDPEYRLAPSAALGTNHQDNSDRRSMRRRSSQALAQDDNSILLLFPQPDGRPIIPNPPLNNTEASLRSGSSSIPIRTLEPVSSAKSHRSSNSRDRFGPDDYHDDISTLDSKHHSHSTIYDMYNPPQQSSPEQYHVEKSSPPSNPTSYSQRAQLALNYNNPDYVRFLQENSRPPRPQPRVDSLKDSKAVKILGLSQIETQDISSPPAPLPRNLVSRQGTTSTTTAPTKTGRWHIHPQMYRPSTQPVEVDANPPFSDKSSPSTQSEVPNQPNVSKQLSSPFTPVDLDLSSVAHSNPIPRSNPPLRHQPRSPSMHTTHSSSPSVLSNSTSNPTPISSAPLILPTDTNLLGFCKGAFRLQIGLTAKSFIAANRPIGYSAMIPYWRCSKCSFEGPMHTTSAITGGDGKKKVAGKPVKEFDPRIRVAGSSTGDGSVAVRYKWAFLAKCHVPLKGMVPFETPQGQSGEVGTFGCIFCAVEGKARGWISNGIGSSGSIHASDPSNASIKSATTTIVSPTGQPKSKVNISIIKIGRSGTTAKQSKTGHDALPEEQQFNGTPTFGNLTSFMAHLENVHRSEDGWPNPEMQGRFRCVVGRVAGVEEEGWDVNIVPLS